MRYVKSLTGAVLILLVSSAWILLGFLDNPVIRSIDRNAWLAKSYLFNHEYAPVETLSVLQIQTTGPSDFYFDSDLKQKLVRIATQHQGPIISNIDPTRLLEDQTLSPLLERPNFVRPILYQTGIGTSDDQRHQLITSGPLEQRALSNVRSPIRLLPTASAYFDGDRLFGVTSYMQDAATQYVSEFHFVHEPGHLRFATAALSAFILSKGCKTYKLSLDGKLNALECQNEQAKFKVPERASLSFAHKLNMLTIDSESHSLDQILIIDLVSPQSYFSNVFGDRTTWGTLSAHALSDLITSRYFSESKTLDRLVLMIAIMAVLALAVLFSRVSAFTLLMISLGTLTAIIAIDVIATVMQNIRGHSVAPALAVSTAGFLAWLLRLADERVERMRVERAFRGYVSDDRLKRIVDGRESLELKGTQKELTTLMIDIVKFSQITHSLNPERLFSFIREFFSIVDPLILEGAGMIDKMTGDGLFAVFGDDGRPIEEATRNAVLTALKIQKVITAHDFQINSPVAVRIGINTGSLFIGNAGSEIHFNYTVLGESANLTERLQTACPPGGVLVGQRTAEYLDGRFRRRTIQFVTKSNDAMSGELIESFDESLKS